MRALNRPRVLFAGLAAYGAHGGIQRFNRRIATNLEGIAAHSAVVMKEDRADAMPTATTACTAIGAGGSTAIFTLAFLREAWRSDVLLLGHINLLPFAALYRLVRPRGRIVLFAHGIEVWGDVRYREPKRWEGTAIKHFIDEVAIVSRYSRERMKEAFHLDGAKFSLFPNTVSVLAAPAVTHLTKSNTIIVVSRLGTNEAEKNIDQVIRAMPALCAAIPEARLRIIGDGALRPSLETLVSELQMQDVVLFDGFVDDEVLARAYEDAALFVLPSSKEGFGIVYLEAWLRGLPVIASKHGAGAEIVSDGVDGMTVEPADVDAITQAIIRLLRNESLRKQMAAAGLDKVRRHYSDEVLHATLLRLVQPKRRMTAY